MVAVVASVRAVPKRVAVAVVTVGTVAAVIGIVAPANAATIAVTTTLDEHNNSAPCSLREAIRSANANIPFGGCSGGSGADTISLPPGTYVLGRPNDPAVTDEHNAVTGDLDILEDVLILGSGAKTTIVDGNGGALADRVFDVRGPTPNVTFSGLTIRGGNEPSGAAGGGGVSNEAKTTFTDVVISGNATGSGGGGVSNGTGAASTFVDSTIYGNVAAASGGGLRNGSSASLTLIDTTVTGNSTNVSGGGISNDGGANVTNSTISGNLAANDGGGVFNSAAASSALANSTVTGNRSNLSGGGVYGGTTTLANVTMTANAADSDANGTGDGGGLAGTAVTVKNSIIGGNLDSSPPPGLVNPECQAALTSQGYNLISNNAGCTGSAGPGDKIGSAASPISAGLAPLANNGGPTFTHALITASPAHNAGSPAPPGGPGDACAGTDQRGVPRPQGGRCEIGAFEAAECFNAIANRVGTSGPDVLRGTSGPDVFLGFGGNDRIKGLGGNDRACGGKGKDTLVGGGGKDRLAGGDGRDRMFGGDAADLLRGGAGDDALIGGPGSDRCAGGSGTDRADTCEREGQIP
jgi:CSLREA domain-containing protein